ncbi:MAG: hypothetical protein WCI60_00915 [bacterium]
MRKKKIVAENKFTEINGKFYDDLGYLINDQSGAITGTSKPTKKFTDITPNPRTVSTQKSRKVASDKKRPIQKSNTLLRKAVKKPNLSKSGSQINAKNSALSPATSSVAASRLLRARATKKSPLITKFNENTSSRVNYTNPQPIAKKPINTIPNPETKKKYNPFDDAVERAVVPKHHSSIAAVKPKRFLSTTNIFGLLFIVVGFIILYFSMPNMNARYVAYKSGVNIVLPYKIPAGYKLETDIPYNTDSVRLVYSNGSKTFSLVEQVDSTVASQPLSDITKLSKSSSLVYGWTKSNLDFFLVTNNNLSQYDINNIYSST